MIDYHNPQRHDPYGTDVQMAASPNPMWGWIAVGVILAILAVFIMLAGGEARMGS